MATTRYSSGDDEQEPYPVNTAANAYYNDNPRYDARDSYDSQARPSMNINNERQSMTDEHGWDLPAESDNSCLRAMCSPFVWCLQCFTKGNVNGCYF